MKLFKKVFVDKSGNYVGFDWWFRWAIASWHLKKWLHYEGMPREITDMEDIIMWERKTFARIYKEAGYPKELTKEEFAQVLRQNETKANKTNENNDEEEGGEAKD